MDTTSSVLVDNMVSLEINADTQPNKCRKRKSMVWDHFTVEATSPETARAICKHCNKSYAFKTGGKMSGTSHLKRHIESGNCPINPKINQRNARLPNKRRRSSVHVPLNQDRCNHEMIDHPGFAGLVQVLYEARIVLTRPNHLTAIDLYHGMTKLQLELTHLAMGEDSDARNEKFDLYLRRCLVAVVMDPRFKMQLIKFAFTKSYGDEDAKQWIKIVDDSVHDLYLSYSEQNLMDAYVVDLGFSETDQDMPQDANIGQSGDETSPQVEQTTESHEHDEKQNVEESQRMEVDDSQAVEVAEEDHTSFPVDVLLQEGSTLVTIEESLSEFDIYISEMETMKTELDQYLEETLLPRSQDFKVLSWWGLKNTTYPTLSRMAVDLLFVHQIPYSTHDRGIERSQS